MFGNSLLTVGGDIPNDITKKIQMSSNIFFSLVKKLVQNGYCDRRIVRLLKPCNICVLLDDTFVHFVLTNKGVGGVIKFQHADFRGKGTGNMQQVIAIVERDLAFEDCFGFSVPSALILNNNPTEEELLPFVEQYLKSEILFHERLAKIVRINPIFKGRDFFIEENNCFVLMPFNSENHLQEVYEDHIKPTVSSCGFNCLRADNIYDNNAIIENIWENINKAKVIIAELTGKNPNVFYELGIAHTIGKEVILVSQNIDDVPFDLRHLRIILYETTPRGVSNLEKQLTATINAIINKSI